MLRGFYPCLIGKLQVPRIIHTLHLVTTGFCNTEGPLYTPRTYTGGGRAITSSFFLILGLNQGFSFLIVILFFSHFSLIFRKGFFFFLICATRFQIDLKVMRSDVVAFQPGGCKLFLRQTPQTSQNSGESMWLNVFLV